MNIFVFITTLIFAIIGGLVCAWVGFKFFNKIADLKLHRKIPEKLKKQDNKFILDGKEHNLLGEIEKQQGTKIETKEKEISEKDAQLEKEKKALEAEIEKKELEKKKELENLEKIRKKTKGSEAK